MKSDRRAGHFSQRMGAVLLAIGLSMAAMRPAAATDAPPCAASPVNTAITIAPVSITPGTSNGKIGSPSAPVTVSIDCWPAFFNTTNYYDNFTVRTGQLAALDVATPPPGGVGVMFKTNIPGIDFLLTGVPAAISGNNGPNGTVGWALGTSICTSVGSGSCSPNPIAVSFTGQLVKTGPVAPGTVSNIQILQFFDSDVSPAPPWPYVNTIYSTASASFGTLTLNAVTVSMSACSVSGPTTLAVALPAVSTSALASTGAVAGQTLFNLRYSCPAGWSLSMTMSTATPGAAPGVILSPASCPSGPSANRVGVQLLQGNQTPVTFNTAQALGNSPNGILAVPYYARYYATATPVGAGPVCATATFTMSYQ